MKIIVRQNRQRFCAAPISVLALASSCLVSHADFGPNLGTETALNSGLSTPLRNAARTYEVYYAAPAFASVSEPTTLTGIQFRLAIGENWRPPGYLGATWPNANLNFSSFKITLAKASAQLAADGEYVSLAPSFASYLSSPVVVRSGPLTVNTASFPADGGPVGIHSWGPTISFSLNYTINPGESLVMLINHSGYGASGTPLQALFASRDYQNGLTDSIASTTSGNATAPNGFSSPLFVNFTIVPEPGSAKIAALGGLIFLIGRRSRRLATMGILRNVP